MSAPHDDARTGVDSSEFRKRGRTAALAVTTAVALTFGSLGAIPAFAADEPVDAPASSSETASETEAPSTPAPDDTVAPPAIDAPAEPVAPVEQQPAEEQSAEEQTTEEPAPAEAPEAPARIAAAASVPATHTIADVQGTTNVSPVSGQTVTV